MSTFEQNMSKSARQNMVKRAQKKLLNLKLFL